MEVPLFVEAAVLEEKPADKIRSPGAKISTQAPIFENVASRSIEVLAATVTAFGALAGE